MAAGLHGSARRTPRVRAELQAAQASTRTLAAQYGLECHDSTQKHSKSHLIANYFGCNPSSICNAVLGMRYDCHSGEFTGSIIFKLKVDSEASWQAFLQLCVLQMETNFLCVKGKEWNEVRWDDKKWLGISVKTVASK